MKISVIIPVKPQGRVAALAPLGQVDYPSEDLEIIVAEGRSPSSQRNLAAAAATGDILYFLDDDSLAQPDLLQRAALHFSDPAVAAAGGPSLTPDTDSPLQHAFAMAFTSIFGGGAMRNRYRKAGDVRATGDHELILCNMGFRRELFLRYGGFDERLYPNEENELMDRIVRGGGLLLHDPGMVVMRSQRRTVKAFCRQLFGYGRGRGEQTRLSGVVKPVTFVPALFCLYLLMLPFLPALFYLPLLLYLCLVVSFSLFRAITSGRLVSGLMLLAVLPLFHVCHGLGLMKGLVTQRVRETEALRKEVRLRKVKEFGTVLAPMS